MKYSAVIFESYVRNNRLEKALQSADSISVSIGTLVSPMLKYRRFRITVSITRFSIFQVERLCFVKTHGSIRGNYISLCWKSISSGKKKKKEMTVSARLRENDMDFCASSAISGAILNRAQPLLIGRSRN